MELIQDQSLEKYLENNPIQSGDGDFFTEVVELSSGGGPFVNLDFEDPDAAIPGPSHGNPLQELINVVQAKKDNLANSSDEVNDLNNKENAWSGPSFVLQDNKVKKAEHKGKGLYTVKKDARVQLEIAENLVQDSYFIFGLYHCHPDYALDQLDASHVDKNGNSTPFKCFNKEVHFRQIKVPSSAGAIPMTIALVHLVHERFLDLSFVMTSSDAKNHGLKKDGKEWKAFIAQPDQDLVNELVYLAPAQGHFTITTDQLTKMNQVHVQVKQVIRKGDDPIKDHRSFEVTFPTPKAPKRKHLEADFDQIMKKFKENSTDKELQIFNDLFSSY